MSIRVLVVDDEPIAAQATAVMVGKADPELEVIGLCYSGRDAVNQALILHPDIIIMDIQMPGIGGLEAMRRIQEGNPHTSFIVLSAYSEFGYAVEALTMGACDYLLKPVRQVNFSASLQKVAADVRARKEELDVDLQQQEQLQIALPMIKKDFVRALVPGSNAAERLVACASFLGVSQSPGLCVALEHRRGGGGQALEGLLDNLSRKTPLYWDLVRPELAAAYAPVPRDSDPERFPDAVRQLLHALLQEQDGGDALAGIGLAVKGTANMKTAMLQAISALEYLKEGQQDDCAVYDQTAMPLSPAHQEQDAGEATSSTGMIIEKATRYIKENYHREITLDEVASWVNLSPFYFSRFFKEYTGTNFSELLLQVRVDKAKELLARPGSSIKDVAYQVGYNDPNYFSRVFRKATGIKASDFRAFCDNQDSGGGMT